MLMCKRPANIVKQNGTPVFKFKFNDSLIDSVTGDVLTNEYNTSYSSIYYQSGIVDKCATLNTAYASGSLSKTNNKYAIGSKSFLLEGFFRLDHLNANSQISLYLINYSSNVKVQIQVSSDYSNTYMQVQYTCGSDTVWSSTLTISRAVTPWFYIAMLRKADFSMYYALDYVTTQYTRWYGFGSASSRLLQSTSINILNAISQTSTITSSIDRIYLTKDVTVDTSVPYKIPTTE